MSVLPRHIAASCHDARNSTACSTILPAVPVPGARVGAWAVGRSVGVSVEVTILIASRFSTKVTAE